MAPPDSLRSPGEQETLRRDDDQLRKVLFVIRLTAAERERLRELAGERQISIASHVRAAALGSPLPPRRPQPRPVPELNQEAYWQLGQVGNILNQIARRLNTADGDTPTLAGVALSLEALQRLL